MAKQIKLYFVADGYGAVQVSDVPPNLNPDGEDSDSDDRLAMNICEQGLKVFGLGRLKPNQVVRATITVDSLEIGETSVTYKPYVQKPKNAKKNGKGGKNKS